VRRINISGNARTRDEVVRREIRQYEGAWYDADRIRVSRERLNRLGYFTSVSIEPQPVPDAPDQVDLNVTIEERSTGQFLLGVGFSSTDSLVLTASVNQQNFFGTGKSLGLNINTGKTQRTLVLNSTDPYFTQDGVSRSFDAFYRRLNAIDLNLGDYVLTTSGVGLRFGLPYTEIDRITFGVAYESNDIQLGANPPSQYVDYVAAYGPNSWAVLGVLGWTRDNRDSSITPTRGSITTAAMDFTFPVGDLRYVRAGLLHQHYFPLTKDYTLALSGDIAKGWSPSGYLYPIFKNYYVGGIGSVRGFEPNSLGPTNSAGTPIGGQAKIVGSAEFLFPLPGSGNDRSIRLFGFTDVGNVFTDRIELSELRASAGVGLSWLSPLGPLKLSLGWPIRREPTDKLQKFQFQIGTGF
jgi:outer membrane protein insertion porin family